MMKRKLELECVISKIHEFEDKSIMWIVSIDTDSFKIVDYTAEIDTEKEIEYLSHFFCKVFGFFREVKPFLSLIDEEFITLNFEWRHSPKYGKNLTLTSWEDSEGLKIDVEGRCFRTHCGSMPKNSHGCWVFSNEPNMGSEFSLSDNVAFNTRATTQRYHEILKEYERITYRARLVK